MKIAEGASIVDLFGDSRAGRRAQTRLYYVLQAVAWGLFLLLPLLNYLTQPNWKPGAYPKTHPIGFVVQAVIFPALAGFALTHFVRFFINRWGWKRLTWSALVPRIFVVGIVLAAIWMLLIHANGYLIWHNPNYKVQRTSLFLVEVVDNSFLFDGWLVAYLLYHLFQQLMRLENERLSLVAAMKETELRALKSQVNPHFIFNSLNSLRALIDENPARARLAVTQLANLLRYSLQRTQLATVTLEEELRITRDYLALEQVRYENGLRFRIEVSPEALPRRIPPMLLQTLVENAVKYGIAQLPEGGEILIQASCSDRILRIQVTNPVPPETPSQLGEASTGLGLRNAAHQLRLLFGEGATLQLRMDSPALVVANVAVPLQPAAI